MENEYIDVVKKNVKDETNIDQMIQAVSFINTQLVVKLQTELKKKEKDEIIEAYDYIFPRMMTCQKNYEKICKNWFGDYPLFFRVGMNLKYERELEEMEDGLKQFSRAKQEMFDKIVNEVWNKRYNRMIVVNATTLEIPKTIYRNELDDYKYSLMVSVYQFLKLQNGVFIFSYEKNGTHVKSALRMQEGKVFIIDTDELEWCYTHDQYGNEIEVDEEEKFVLFNLA